MLLTVDGIDVTGATAVDDDFVGAIAESSVGSTVVQLDLKETSLTDAAGPLLRSFSQLDSVSVSSTKFGDKGCDSLAELSQLTYLGL